MPRNLLEPWKDNIISDLPHEVWKDVVNFEGLYQVSNLGRIKSIERIIYKSDGNKMKINPRIKAQHLYIRNELANSANVTLSKDSRQTHLGVSIIVGQAFLGKTKKNEIYCHLNKNPFDNRVKNLKIMTRKESSAINIKLGKHKFIQDFNTNPLYIKQRYKSIYKYNQIDPHSNKVINSLTNKEISNLYSHLDARIIERIGKGVRLNKMHLGFIWERILI